MKSVPEHYSIFNNLENKIIFSSNLSRDLIIFTKKIASENEDEHNHITTSEDAMWYIRNYCDNLTMIHYKKL